MRISDWSSDVCSSDLAQGEALPRRGFDFQLATVRRQPLAHAGQAVAGVRILGAPTVVARLQADRIAVPGVAQPQDLRLRVPHRVGDDLLGAAQQHVGALRVAEQRSEEHTSELQSLKRKPYA